MDWYEDEVRALEARLCETVTAAPPVVFYGSSSVRQWTSLARDFPDVPVLNCGFGGSTMEACSWFFWRLVPPLKPAALVLYAGDNDLGDGREPPFVLAQLGHLLAQLDRHASALPLILMSIKPSPSRIHLRAHIEATNAGIRAVAEARAHTRYVDVFTPMLRDDRPRSELFLDDGLHLNDAGYRLWRDVLNAERSGIF